MAKAKKYTACDECGTFDDMDLKQELLMSIQGYGYPKPTAVQRKIIVPLYKEGCDLLVQVADFEPGKTWAICVGILQSLNCESGVCQAVVFTSSDASSRRIGKDMEKLGGPLGVKVHILGDHPCFPPLYQVIVATPINYMLWLKFVDRRYWTKHIKLVVFDKADQMLDYELSGPLKYFPSPLPRVAFFTETVPDEVKIAANAWSKTQLKTITVPHTIQLDKKVEGKHFVLCVPRTGMKFDALTHLYLHIQGPSVIFVNEPETAMQLYEALRVWDLLTVFCTTEDTDENARALIETALQAPVASVLITTDEWANDIDLMQVRSVVNYDMPTPYYKPQDYLRRMSRFGGRADAFNIVTVDEWFTVFEIQHGCDNSVVFEGYTQANHPQQLQETLEHLPFPCPEATEDIHHVLIRIDEEEHKIDAIWYELSNYVGKGKAVVFAGDDRGKKLLGDTRFNVFTMENLQEFLTSPAECCILLVDRVDDTLNDAHPKVPVVFNFDIPFDKFIYNNRIAWCGEGGFVVHLATDEDYLKMIHFQLPKRRVFCWLSDSNEIAEIVQKASSKLVGLVQPETFYLSPARISQPETFYLSPARISQAGLDQELICPAIIPASATPLEETTLEPFDTTLKPRSKKPYTWMGAWKAVNKRSRKSKFYHHTI